MRKLSLFALATASVCFAHHGVASLGAAGLEGPGAPLETSSSATLPEGSWLLYMKLDRANFKKYSFQQFPDQKDTADFWLFGVGYGLKSWLSLYMFVPYNVKKEIRNSGADTFTSAGFADPSVMAVLGFKYDRGFRLVPSKESLEDMMDWHFTLYGGLTFPTGNANKKGYRGEFAPDMALGFGKPSLTLGFTATKQFINFPQLTFFLDTSYLKFFEHKYNTGDKYKFGDEIRLNTALVYRLYTNHEKKLRLDFLVEANYLYLQKDKENGVKVEDSGGQVIYNTLGARLYYKSVSLGAGIKVPVWKNLNMESQQQGAEGKEKYRLILTLSTLF